MSRGLTEKQEFSRLRGVGDVFWDEKIQTEDLEVKEFSALEEVKDMNHALVPERPVTAEEAAASSRQLQ